MVMTRASQLVKFLYLAQTRGCLSSVLDCGAGGDNPPLYLFHMAGFQTTGVEISEKALEKARQFERTHECDLGIIQGDMRSLPFGDDEFDLCYSYNSVFHMVKTDIRRALEEMTRVTQPGGLIFVNLLSTEDCLYGEGKEVGPGEFLQEEEGETIHAFFTDAEVETIMSRHSVVEHEKRILTRTFDGERIRQVFHDMILEVN